MNNGRSKQVRITNLLGRGVEHIYPSKQHLEKLLTRSKKLRIKHGVDPTGERIHLGRAISLLKLREFQNLGHTIILVIGDFTAQIGDPSDKLEKRPFLSVAQIKKNLKNYLPQIGKIIDIKKTEVHYNSTWLKKFTLYETAQLAEQFTIQQILQRRNFKERIKGNHDISMRELLYPLMQGYDSVMVKADIEIGGSDQLFNLMAGRKIQERYDQEPQTVLVTKMLIGLDGRKMSTSWGNVVNIIDAPNEIYGKIMSMHDEHIADYLELTTSLSPVDIKEKVEGMNSGRVNPRDVKAILARLLVEQYHGTASARAAEAAFDAIFKQKKIPEHIPTIKVRSEYIDICQLLVDTGLSASKSEAQRLIKQGGIKMNRQRVSDWKEHIHVRPGDIIQVGKRRFVKIRL